MVICLGIAGLPGPAALPGPRKAQGRGPACAGPPGVAKGWAACILPRRRQAGCFGLFASPRIFLGGRSLRRFAGAEEQSLPIPGRFSRGICGKTARPQRPPLHPVPRQCRAGKQKPTGPHPAAGQASERLASVNFQKGQTFLPVSGPKRPFPDRQGRAGAALTRRVPAYRGWRAPPGPLPFCR